MNYLAHCVLSGSHPAILFGNFIADSVRGKMIERYPVDIRRGILLHRFIDQFTDTHEVFRQSKSRLWFSQRHYAAVVVDMVYDHFLALHFEHFTGRMLGEYAEWVYGVVESFKVWMPPRVRQFFPHMRRQNWLYAYRDLHAVEQALLGMSHRSRQQPNPLVYAPESIRAHYHLLFEDFCLFFPDIQRASKEWRSRQSSIWQ